MMITLMLFSLLAHGGGLDSQGGHFNRKTGQYHFHDGIGGGGRSYSEKEYQRLPPIDKPKPSRSKNVREDQETTLLEKVFLIVYFLFFMMFVFVGSRR
ncbi:YHYH domain-containing protein [Rubripirellula sp.]|nr:YHYH domain-containing protein [Rubripirellula sp.]